MYYREEAPRPSSVYIPPSYRGNALYLEQLGREEERCGDSECECRPEPPPRECIEKRTHPPEDRGGEGILGRIMSFLGSDGAVVAAVVLFLLFSRKGKQDECGDDMLTVLLLLLVLL